MSSTDDYDGLFANPNHLHPNAARRDKPVPEGTINRLMAANQVVKMTPFTPPLMQFGAVDRTRGKYVKAPTKSHHDDAGYDLYTSERVVIPAGQFRDIPTNLWVAMPHSLWGLVTGRSSALRKHGLLVHSGVIDAGYRGELFAGAFNLSGHSVTIEQGERMAQFIPIERPELLVGWVDGDPPPGTRGSNGFGSTGR